MNAKGTFVTFGWTPQEPYDVADGTALAFVTLSKTFEGDLAGSSSVTMIVSSSEREDSRSYVAMERVSCALGGREGTFVLQHNAVSDQGEDSLVCAVVPGSGTGGLTGLRGRMQILVAPDGSHSYILDYEL
ncbi:DUF3224 domain-containing protein [Nonomuraea dietziae]|uniref:DUF3224 domain-containing protein n=1 Tax=Nonomuraea dietziae TaxID=65515 RepID=A0A7W5V6Z2_9ACTN|nr:DUF3224 domain-containing protein [Nonomuraea dietziae]MBB3727138.1 hypothetical protein [Nonomuraea dietziae]